MISKLLDLLSFFSNESKFSKFKEIFINHNEGQGIFPQSRNFFTINKFFIKFFFLTYKGFLRGRLSQSKKKVLQSKIKKLKF